MKEQNEQFFKRSFTGAVFHASGSSSENLFLRSGRKPANWMMDPISRFSKAGELVVDTREGTLPDAKDFMQLPQHRLFAGLQTVLMRFV